MDSINNRPRPQSQYPQQPQYNEPQYEQDPQQSPAPAPRNNLLIPAAIVIAGVLVAGALYFTNRSNQAASTQVASATTQAVVQAPITIDPVSAQDHITGSTSSPITIVEFSDLECPYCKVFQTTLQQVMTQYGQAGSVAWVFRQFPLYKPGSDGTALHPKAEKEAEASECANQLGGSTAFWNYIDKIFEITPSNNGLDPAELPIVAGQIGLNVTNFNTCLSSGKYTQFVSDSYDKAKAAGGNGTPYSVMILATKITSATETKIMANVQTALNTSNPGTTLPAGTISFDPSGTKIAVSGALPYSVIAAIIDTVLAAK